MAKLDEDDIAALVAELAQIDDYEASDIEDWLIEKFDIDFDTFKGIVELLVEHTPAIQAGLTQRYYNAFVSKDGPYALVKTPFVGWRPAEDVREKA
jgi:hypothetical protein